MNVSVLNSFFSHDYSKVWTQCRISDYWVLLFVTDLQSLYCQQREVYCNNFFIIFCELSWDLNTKQLRKTVFQYVEETSIGWDSRFRQPRQQLISTVFRWNRFSSLSFSRTRIIIIIKRFSERLFKTIVFSILSFIWAIKERRKLRYKTCPRKFYSAASFFFYGPDEARDVPPIVQCPMIK